MRLVLSFILLISSLNLWAIGINQNKAKEVAVNFLYQNCQSDFQDINKELNLVLTEIKKEGNQPLYYIFNNTKKEGFVIVSALQTAQPILAYSNESSFYTNEISKEAQSLMKGYSKALRQAAQFRGQADEKIAQAWQQLEHRNGVRTSVTSKQGPLLLTKWNQAPYYNDFCPTSSSGEKSVVGCVAVALAQVMKFYNYPEKGKKVSYHSDYEGETTHAESIDYRDKTFYWDRMPLQLGQANPYVAEMMFLAGHSVKMDWEVDGSGTQTQYCKEALEEIYGYKSTVQIKVRQDYYTNEYYYTPEEWENILVTELDAQRPIIYAGYSDVGGHAWNCDGYQMASSGKRLFHMNYGWGGSGNGYFLLTELISGTVPGEEPSYFDHGHKVVVGIEPGNDYSKECPAERLIEGFEGSVGDGSNNADYGNNLYTKTLIKPACGTIKTKIKFVAFDLAEGDTVLVYDGETEEGALIAKYDKDHFSSGYLTGSGNGILVVFKTDAQNTATGWNLVYEGKKCGFSNRYEKEGIIEDGSGECLYDLGKSCIWKLQPEGANSITLKFDEFDLDNEQLDVLKIYKNSSSNSNLVLELKGTDTPPDSLVIDAAKAILKFKTSSQEHTPGEGWRIKYHTDDKSSIINNKDLNDKVSVKAFPNPFKSTTRIELKGFQNQETHIELLDVVGQVVANKQYDVATETMSFNIEDILDRPLSSGVYILNVYSKQQKRSIKLVVE